MRVSSPRAPFREVLSVDADPASPTMIAELLLILAGYESTLFLPSPPAPARPTTFVLGVVESRLFHPGEVSSLNTLAQLAFRYAKIRRWATETRAAARRGALQHSVSTPPYGEGHSARRQPAPSQYMAALASSLLQILSEYEALILETEAKILSKDAALVGASPSFVPLASLLATFAPWQSPIASLSSLIDTLSARPSDWSPGALIDLLQDQSLTGFAHISTLYRLLSRSIQRTWLSHLLLFLVHGLPSPSPESLAVDVGPDPASPHRRVYKLKDGSMPHLVGERARDSILWSGRAVATVKAERKELPRTLIESMTNLVKDVLPENELEFGRAVEQVRGEIGE